MEILNTWLADNGPLKRAGAAAGGVAVIALNKKFNLGLDAIDIGSMTTIIAAFLVQSGIKARADKAGAETAAAIATPPDAAAALGGKVAP